VRNHDKRRVLLKPHLKGVLTMDATALVLISIPVLASLVVIMEDMRVQSERKQQQQ
jgi:hypothetical protein